MTEIKKSDYENGETAWQFRLDVFIGLLFLTVTLFALQRCVNSWQGTGGRKVISVFNTLIFLAGLFRSIWFLIPNHYWESSYDPLPLTAFSSDTFWQGTLASEIFLLLGTYFLYGIFILIACYWYTMLRKLEPTNSSSPDGSTNPTTSAVGLITPASRDSNQVIGALDLFFPIMGGIAVLEGINILLFLSRTFNEENMIVFDGIVYIILSLLVVCSIVYLSRQINGVLKNMEIINQSSSQSQIRRINLISMLASFFFSSRAIFELIMTAAMIHAMRSSAAAKGQHVHVAEPWWTIYIACKHIAEVLALGFELFISSAIRSYDNSRILARWDPLASSSSNARSQATKVELASKPSRNLPGSSSMAYGPANVAVSGGYGAAFGPNSSNSNNPSLVGSKYSAGGGGGGGSGGRSMFYQSVPATPIEGNYLSETSPMLPQPPAGIPRGGGGNVRGKASKAIQLQNKDNSSSSYGSNYL